MVCLKKSTCVTTVQFIVLIGLFTAGKARAAGTNPEHEIQVYSIETYSTLSDYCTSTNPHWKVTISLDDTQDPYYYFWREMYTDCSGSTCANTASIRRRNSAVTVNSMINDGVDDWKDADMVFFYGHNAMIQPQWSYWYFSQWVPHYLGEFFLGWCQEDEDDWINWGTSSDPYYYHRQTVTTASLSNPYAIFYTYNALTSVLPGKDFSSTGTWYTENTWSQTSGDSHSGLLDGDTEWIIAHGCQAVTTAKAQNGYWPTDPIVPCSLGVNAWSKTWDNLHMILGHYYELSTDCEPQLGDDGSPADPNDFASMLKAGDVIKDAYFDIHGLSGSFCNQLSSPAWSQPSAISESSTSCCYFNGFAIVCPGGGCSNGYMNAETWTAPMSDLSGSTYYATAWRVVE